LRSRLLGGKLEKAQQGQLRFRPPTGLVYDPAGQLVLDPDQQVQQAVRLVFDLFDQFSSALAVVQYFATHHVLFPTRGWGGLQHGELTWQPLSNGRVLAMLHNPAYAGVYVYGRTQTRTRLLPGETPRIKGRTRQIKSADWPIVIQAAHPGYLSWEQFLRNQQRLEDNRTYHPDDQRGAVREGTALLQGIILCGRCGRRMSVRYTCPAPSTARCKALADGRIPYYVCAELHAQRAEATCQGLRGDAVDATVAKAFLEAMQPAQLEVSLATLDQIEDRARQLDQHWQLRLERAHYEAELAQRRFRAVEPENRLVARSLEHDWNETLAAIERLEHEYATLPRLAPSLVSPEERQRILALAQDLPTVWQAPTTTHAQRKQLLRFLIKDVTLTQQATSIQIGLRWQTEALTPLEIARPKRSYEVRRTSGMVIERIHTLAPEHTDREIATLLNQAQLTPGLGGQFTESKVKWIRYTYGIPLGCPQGPAACPTGQRGDGRYSARTAAHLLNVNVSTIANWCTLGILEGVQETPHGPRWITLTPDRIVQLRKPMPQHWKRSTAPDSPAESSINAKT
jgi:hypothetical protein